MKDPTIVALTIGGFIMVLTAILNFNLIIPAILLSIFVMLTAICSLLEKST
jgi:hypothetical protein